MAFKISLQPSELKLFFHYYNVDSIKNKRLNLSSSNKYCVSSTVYCEHFDISQNCSSFVEVM